MDRPKLIIGNKNYSSWSLRAWLILAKLGVDFEEVRLTLDDEKFADRVSAYSAAGRVPVYLDGSAVVWDSLAIAEYLAEVNRELWPSDRSWRARARSLSAEMHSGFTALRREMPMNCRATARTVPRTPALTRDIARVMAIFSGCREISRSVGPWLFGKFSIADAAFAPVVFRFRTYSVVGSTLEAGEYMSFVLDDPQVKDWLRGAESEPEVIQAAELGLG